MVGSLVPQGKKSNKTKTSVRANLGRLLHFHLNSSSAHVSLNSLYIWKKKLSKDLVFLKCKLPSWKAGDMRNSSSIGILQRCRLCKESIKLYK